MIVGQLSVAGLGMNAGVLHPVPPGIDWHLTNGALYKMTH